MPLRSPLPDAVIPNITFSDLILSVAKEKPNKPALIDGPTGRTLTFAQLAGASRLVAASLAARGFKKGDCFAIYSPNVPEYAIIFHAVAMLGGINTTANPLYTPHELAFQLKDSNAKFLLTIPLFLPNAKQAAEMAGGIEEIFVFGEAEGATPFAALLQSDGKVPAVEIDPQTDLVVLPYSSGTTGLPKGVMLTHSNLVSNIVQCGSMEFPGPLYMTGDDVVLGLLPFYHIYGMVVVMSWALSKGATVVTLPKFEMELFLKVMQDYKVSFAYLAPPLVLGLAKHPLVSQYDLSSLRAIISGAAPLGAELEAAVKQRLGCEVSQGYGMTESSPVITFNIPSNGKPQASGSCGLVVPNTEMKLVDIASLEEVGPNQEGEVWARGPQVMTGYLNNPQATANTITADGWLRTGDIGYVNDDGYLFVVDRLKELIKYKGLQVAPAELEAVLLTHPAVADAAVIGVPDDEAGELPKAFVVLKGEATVEQIMAHVAERVAPFKKVRMVEIVTQIPKSSSGKILRRVLKDQEKLKGA
jgi:acyl-CoA synthetase (AMP-forming)/AMP-acid ligase II